MKIAPISGQPRPDLPGTRHSLMEGSPVPMAELEGAGHIVRYVNPAFCRLVGKPKKALVGNSFAETMQGGNGCLAVLERVYRTGEAETHTEPEHRGAHPVYWSYAMWPVLGSDQPVGVMMQVTETTRFHQQAGAMNEALVLSSVRQHELTGAAERLNEQLQAEIADRKAANEALRESEAKYRMLFDAIDEGFCIIEKVETVPGEPIDFRYLAANPAFAAQSGVGDVVGRTIREAFPGEPEEWFNTYDAILTTGKAVRFQRGLVTQGRVLELYAFRVEDETCRRVAVIFADITRRRQHEEERGRLAAIVESSDDPIISKDLNGIITTWNRAAERLFGYTGAEALGNSITMLIPPDRHDEEPKILARVRRGERVEHYETVRQRKNGSSVDVSLTVSPVRNAAGQIVGASKIARDITERKQHEERQKMLLNELSHRVKNTLATVQSVAMQTMRSAPTMEAFQDAFEARLEAFAKTHNLLMQNPAQIVTLHDLVVGELSHYAADDGSRYAIEGDGVSLESNRAVPIGMMFHELATNAAKYGAFSISSGQVKVSWTVGQGAQRTLHLHWVETGGPAVEKPGRRGFGSRLIERGLAHELGADVRLIFDPAGVRCTMDIPLPSVAEMS